MHEIVAARIRYGYRRVHIMLKREGWRVGKQVVYRLYREEGLVLRSKRPRRRKMAVHREALSQPSRPNQAWSLDFVHDRLADNIKIRLLTVIDVFTREALAVEVGHRLRADDVARVLNRLVYLRGLQRLCLRTMERNSPVRLSISGPTRTALRWIPPDQVRRPTT
ncbi:IS3 family transposase, partial [Rhodobacteraceae bacterium NNCM2]|nr:IS3 family transposase [Coraliihabitans acroporae]